MISWPASRVAAVLGTGEVDSSATFSSVSTDTRSLTKGALFVALEGVRFDGHDYLAEAALGGAGAAVVRRGTQRIGGLIQYEVSDTGDALRTLARERRREILGPVIAVTGTNGKTSTKEMLAAALGVRWIVHATRANMNNLVGVPLTILEAPQQCDALVVEIGANAVGEVARLRDVVEPSIGVVTNVGDGHLAGFGSLEGVLNEKTSLLAGLPLAVVGMEPKSLGIRAGRLAVRTITAGLEKSAAFAPEDWELDEQARGRVTVDGVEIRIPFVGRHQLENLMLVVAVAKELGLDLKAVGSSINKVRMPPGRCEVLTSGSKTILQDAYNSNPGSLRALLQAVSRMRGARRLVVVLGTMLELGENSAALHAESAEDVMDADPDLVAVLGEFIPAFKRHSDILGERLISAEDPESLGRLVASRLSGGELLLLKGSRGVALERALPFLLSTEESPCSTTS